MVDSVFKNRDKIFIYPFLKILIFFIIGILFSIVFKNQLIITIVSLSYIFSIIFYVVTFSFYKSSLSVGKRKISVYLSISIHVSFFCAGAVSLYNEESLYLFERSYIIHNCNAFELYDVFEKKSKISNGYLFCANLKKVRIKDEWLKVPKKIPIILFLNKQLDKSVFIDSVVQIRNESKIKISKTIEFGFFQTKSFPTISISVYNVNQIIDCKTEKIFFIQKLLNYFIYSINEYIKSDEVRGTVLCLLFGNKNQLSETLKNAYIATGVMHLLAVSGLHVGIFSFIINSCLSSIIKNKKYFFFKNCITLTFLWFYSLACGMSSSILRATIMFSLKILEEIFSRKNDVYNKLFVSAFFILIFKPYSIFDIGFQLSYLSVIGIAYFASKIYNLFSFRYAIFKYIWKSISVSLAAQIFTLPISVFYFHNLPIYSIISNLFFVPYTCIILHIATFLLFVSKVSFIANEIGNLLEYLVKFQNFIICIIAKLPLCNFNLHITFFTMISFYLLIFECCLFFLYKKFVFLLIFLISIIINFLFFFI